MTADDISPQILGYDVRMDQSVYVADRWPAEERESLLLKQDVEWPLSVDRDVWPSYFVSPPRLRSSSLLTWFADPAPVSVAERVIIIDRDPYHGRLLGLHLWASLDDMLEYYTQRKHDAAPGVVIAVWLEHVRSVPHQQLGTVLYPAASPSVVANDWTFLGYDVANEFMRSALSGLTFDWGLALRDQASSQLNEYGLFSHRQDALDFEAEADRGSPDHRPFCVCGLYRVPVVRGG